MLDDVAEAFGDSLLGEFYFSHVEGTDTGDFVARMDYGGCFALGTG